MTDRARQTGTEPEDRDERQVTLLRRVLAAAAEAGRRTHRPSSGSDDPDADAAVEATALKDVAHAVIGDDDEDDEPTP